MFNLDSNYTSFIQSAIFNAHYLMSKEVFNNIITWSIKLPYQGNRICATTVDDELLPCKKRQRPTTYFHIG